MLAIPAPSRCVDEATYPLRILILRLKITPLHTLRLPAENKGNTLRGAFGSAFRRLVCISQCQCASRCPLDETCPYKVIFEPSPPSGKGRLTGNQDAPRPFVFRPPITTKTSYLPGEEFEFGLRLFGMAVDYLPYFVLAFRKIMTEGFGLNRAPCQLEDVRAVTQRSAPIGVPHEVPVYSSQDELFRMPGSFALSEWVQDRFGQLSGVESVTTDGHRAEPERRKIKIRFLTPTSLKFEERAVREPEFHHLFKRVRDRLNALCTFYGAGSIDTDFRQIGKRSEQIRTVNLDLSWVERSRRSSKTHQRHELSGFIGDCVYEGDVAEFLPWLAAGEIVSVGRHTAWGNGLYELRQQRSDA